MTKDKLVPLARFMSNALQGMMFRNIFLVIAFAGWIYPPFVMPVMILYCMNFSVALYLLLAPEHFAWTISGYAVATLLPIVCLGNYDLFSTVLFCPMAMWFGTQLLLAQALYDEGILFPRSIDRSLKFIIVFYITMPLFINNIREGLTDYLTRKYDL